MIAPRVESEEELQGRLKAHGFEATGQRTATSTLWKHMQTGKHIQVPHAIDGFYPNWLLYDLEDLIGRYYP